MTQDKQSELRTILKRCDEVIEARERSRKNHAHEGFNYFCRREVDGPSGLVEFEKIGAVNQVGSYVSVLTPSFITHDCMIAHRDDIEFLMLAANSVELLARSCKQMAESLGEITTVREDYCQDIALATPSEVAAGMTLDQT